MRAATVFLLMRHRLYAGVGTVRLCRPNLDRMLVALTRSNLVLRSSGTRMTGGRLSGNHAIAVGPSQKQHESSIVDTSAG